jgi:parallel beta-helix repeat protein
MARVSSGANLDRAIERLREGDILIIEAGRYKGNVNVSRKTNIQLRGEGMPVIRGGTLKFSGCDGLSIKGIQVRDSRSHGLFVVDSEDFNISGCQLLHNGGSGILTGNVSGVRIENNTVSDNRGAHGIYVSQSGDDIVIAGNTCERNARCGIQVNANQSNPKVGDARYDGISRGVVIELNTIRSNQRSQDAAGIQLASCRGVRLVNNRVLDHEGRQCVSLWDDGTRNRERACHGVLIAGNVFSFRYPKPLGTITCSPNCTDVVWDDNDFPEGVRALVSE